MGNSGIEDVDSEQCVCQTCEENMKECMRKRDTVRLQVQRDMCCALSCSVWQTFVSIVQRYVVQLKLVMCSVSTKGERASPAQQEGSQLISCNFSYLLL